MDINDYLIDQDGKDWGDLLRPWCPPLPDEFTIWMVNRLGDVFAVFDDQSVHWLDINTGTLTRIADDRDDFVIRIDEGNNANFWLAIPLVDACVEAGKSLLPDQCYSFKIPPILGGLYEVENLEPVDLSVHYTFAADIFRQVKDLPDGTKVSSIKFEP